MFLQIGEPLSIFTFELRFFLYPVIIDLLPIYSSICKMSVSVFETSYCYQIENELILNLCFKKTKIEIVTCLSLDSV